MSAHINLHATASFNSDFDHNPDLYIPLYLLPIYAPIIPLYPPPIYPPIISLYLPDAEHIETKEE